MPSVVWVIIVLVVGALAGETLVLVLHPGHQLPGPAARHGLPSAIYRQSIVLSTMGVAVLLALIYVHTKSFLETRTRSSGAMVAVLAALTVQTLFGSPFAFAALGFGVGGLGAVLFVSAFFETLGLTLFLWLSLG